LPLLGRELPTYLSLSVHNALDERYSEAGFGGFDTPAQGRSAFVEVKQTF
jgi:outer membrane receptor protein involved in Fe transport